MAGKLTAAQEAGGPEPILDICYDCDGTGERDWLSGAPCRRCDGTGLIDISHEVEGWCEDDDPTLAAGEAS